MKSQANRPRNAFTTLVFANSLNKDETKIGSAGTLRYNLVLTKGRKNDDMLSVHFLEIQRTSQEHIVRLMHATIGIRRNFRKSKIPSVK
jgi:hypothetical protein